MPERFRFVTRSRIEPRCDNVIAHPLLEEM
jgi:hypothetical protein